MNFPALTPVTRISGGGLEHAYHKDKRPKPRHQPIRATGRDGVRWGLPDRYDLLQGVFPPPAVSAAVVSESADSRVVVSVG